MKPKRSAHHFLAFFSILLIGFNSCKPKPQKVVKAQKPNIILIMADDLGYGDVGAYGQSKIRTPQLDKMAANGMRFTQHYAGSTVCMPSRAVLMTGFHTGHATVRGNPRWTSTGKAVDLKPEDVTIAEELKRVGYQTAIVGKWGLAESSLASMPLNQGFDHFFGYRKHKTAHHYYPDTLYRDNTPISTKNKVHEKEGKYSHDLITEEALEYIQKQKDTSFFLYLAYTIPHYELEVPEESKAPYKNLGWEERTLKSRKGGYQHDEDGNATYAGMVSRMDADVGRILELLAELEIDENTLVLFTSDNGHEYDRGFFDSNGEFKGHKRDLYDGGIRVPFIAWWPGKIKKGSSSDHIAAFWDFLPTACELAGTSPSLENIDGISYLPTLLGKTGEQQKHQSLYWEFNEWQGPIQAIRKDQWKAVKFLDQPLEVYNILEDPGEENNLASENPVLAAELEDILTSSRTVDPNFKLEFHPRLNKKKK